MHVAIEAQSGRVAAPFGKVPSVPRRTPPEIIELIDKLLTKGMSVPEVQEYVRSRGYLISAGPIYREADRLGLALSPGPRRGAQNAGRPLRGAERRKSRTFTLDPEVLDWIEAQRQPGESSSEVIERCLRRQMAIKTSAM